MLSKFLQKYITLGYDLDLLLPDLIEKNWILVFNKLEKMKFEKQNAINILINGIVINIKFIDNEIYYNPNYKQLINENITSIQKYNNTIIIKDSKYRIINSTLECFYAIEKPLKLDIYSYNNGICFYKEVGLGYYFDFYNIKINVIIIVDKSQYNKEFLNEDYTFNEFVFDKIDLVNSNCWIYHGYHKVKSKQLIDFDMEIDNFTKVVDFNNENDSQIKENEIEDFDFNFEEIKF